MTKIIVGGDVYIGGIHPDDINALSVAVEEFRNADVRVVNVEGPISNEPYLQDKSILLTDPDYTPALKTIGIDIACLANNHTHDLGLQGFLDTAENLTKAGIETLGVGVNIAQASQPLAIDEGIFLINACEQNEQYLKQVELATEKNWGVNNAKTGSLLASLDALNEGAKAIVVLHWGKEHVDLPPPHHLDIMKRLLEHEKVLTVIGGHAHRIQGRLKHAGKSGFFCVGNFVFSDFLLSPPVVSSALPEREKIKNYDITYSYLKVFEPMVKRWKWKNRISILVEIDTTKSGHPKLHFVKRRRFQNEITPISGIEYYLVALLFAVLSQMLRLPFPIYRSLFWAEGVTFSFFWKVKNRLVHAKQLGVVLFTKKMIRRLLFKEYF